MDDLLHNRLLISQMNAWDSIEMLSAFGAWLVQACAFPVPQQRCWTAVRVPAPGGSLDDRKEALIKSKWMNTAIPMQVTPLALLLYAED